jgi:hypothetical protein
MGSFEDLFESQFTEADLGRLAVIAEYEQSAYIMRTRFSHIAPGTALYGTVRSIVDANEAQVHPGLSLEADDPSYNDAYDSWHESTIRSLTARELYGNVEQLVLFNPRQEDRLAALRIAEQVTLKEIKDIIAESHHLTVEVVEELSTLASHMVELYILDADKHFQTV